MIKLNPENKYEKGVEIMFDRFERERDFEKSIELLKMLNERREKHRIEMGAVFAQDLKKNIGEVCKSRIYNTFRYLKNDFPKLKVDGYVNQRYVNAAEILEWLNKIAEEEDIPLFRFLRKEKIMGSEGEYKVMLYKIYDRAARAELINSIKKIEDLIRKGDKDYGDVIKSLNNAKDYAGKSSKLKRASISPDVKKHIVRAYDKSAKVHHKKLLRHGTEYDLTTYDGFTAAKKDIDIIELCKSSIEDLVKEEYTIEGLKKIKKEITGKWMSSAGIYGKEIEALRDKLLNLSENYEATYEGAMGAKSDYERLKSWKKDAELLSEKEYPLETKQIEKEIKEYKLKAAPQYDRTAREIYAKLSKYSENYDLDIPSGRESAKEDIKKLEQTRDMIEELTGETYPMHGLDAIKNAISKKEESEKKEKKAKPDVEELKVSAPRKTREECGLDQDDFMQKMFKDKFGMGAF